MKMSKKKSNNILKKILILVLFTIILGIVGYFNNNTVHNNFISNSNIISTDIQNIPAYSGNPYIILNNNKPSFTENDYTTKAFETYSDLDRQGRCGVAYANICKEVMPLETDERESISSVIPSGWEQTAYEGIIEGNYLYNRCHLIGHQLAGENANEKNLITGTRYMNTEGMLPFENDIDDYIEKNENNHVLYRVTPIFHGNNLVASGVQMEAYSVEDNGKGICGVAPNAKLYGVDWSDSPLYRTIDKKKPTFGDGSNLYCMKIAMLYLVVEKQCQVINISQSAFGVEVRCNASNNNDDAINVINKFNEEFASFLKYVRELSKMEFIICKCANNDNNHDLFFSKDADDDFNLPYILYSDYLKYMNGEFDSTDDETKKYWDEKFKRYAGRISKENCKTHSVNAQWDMISGITDPEIEDMIIVVGAAQNTGKHSSWGKCKHTGYEVTAYSNRGSRVDVLAPGGEKTIDGIPDASIYSTVPYGNGYDGLVGTSMACPHVAGVAAMIFGIDPTFTAKEVKDIIISTATGSYGSVKEQYPLLNARLAVEKAIKLSNEKAKGQTGDDLPFEPSGEHQYRIFYDALTWEEAKAACEAKGGHLATITSEEEQQKLNLYNAGNHKLWIGGYKNTEGQWCWVTGEPWEYENWGDGEPNNSSNVVAGESCVAMWPEKWNDLANSNVYEQSGYICEWEASDVAEETQVEGYTGHLYEFYTLPESEWESGPITWQQAERRCEWKGGHLAVIESSTENFLLYSAMKAKGYENAYFGYSDKSSEGNWKWVNGTSTAYTNWHSGEPNNQDGIEHYAMFYENFQDGTWNDADGIIDAGCAYICEWDDPTDKISQGDSFTDQQLRIIAKDLGVPDDLNVEIRQSPKAYWESAGLWDIYVEITHNGKLVASGSFDVETGEMGRNIYIYTPV